MVGVVDPVAVAVQVLPAGDARRHVAGGLRSVVVALVARHPVGKAVALQRRPGVAGGRAASFRGVTNLADRTMPSSLRLRALRAPFKWSLGAVSHEGIKDGALAPSSTPENNERLAKMLKAYPISRGLNRLARPEDVSGMVAFLASDRAAFITGQSIGVSGGYTML